MLRTRKEAASVRNVTNADPAAERSAMPRRRKRVAFVISHIGPGGAQRVVTNAIKIFVDRVPISSSSPRGLTPIRSIRASRLTSGGAAIAMPTDLVSTGTMTTTFLSRLLRVCP